MSVFRAFSLFLLFNVTTFASLVIAARSKTKIDINTGYFPNKDVQDAFDVELNYSFKKKINKKTALSFSPDIHYNKFKDSKGNHFFLRTENTGVFYKNKNYYFSAGLLSHKFGLTQGLSPMNFIDTFYYANPAEPQNIASPTLRFMYKTRKIRAFVSYLPYRIENIYPGSDSPWIPKKAPESLTTAIDAELLPNGVDANEVTILFPDELTFSFNESIQRDNALSNNVAAGLRFEGDIISSQILLYNGLDTNANLEPSLTLITEDLSSDPVVLRLDGNNIGVTPTNDRISRLGYGLRYITPIKWRLFYEGSLSKGESNKGQQRRSRQTHTGGLEWGVPVGKTLIVGILQAYFSSSSNDSKLGLVSPLNEAYIFAAKWENKKIELGATFLKSESLNVNVINASAAYNFNQKHRLSLNGSIIDGEVSELLSGLIDSDYLSLKLTRIF